jgi:hypothetical protein
MFTQAKTAFIIVSEAGGQMFDLIVSALDILLLLKNSPAAEHSHTTSFKSLHNRNGGLGLTS